MATAETPAAPVQFGTGPHLFIDDFIIESSSNLVRRVATLERDTLSAAPVITSAKHHSFQPFFTVLRDNITGTFRIWYGIPTEDFNPVRSRLAYMESTDGIQWTNTPRILDVGPIQFGASVIDEGPVFVPREQRYKLGWYFEKGLKIATSPDGIDWKPISSTVLIEHNHDINGIYFDPLRKRYIAMLSFNAGGNWNGNRRITRQATSTDVLHWSAPSPVLTPDSRDDGETQFYAMDGFLTRGPLTLGMVKVLRDDLKADHPPQPPEAYGIGYTTLAWTRDGTTWTRERTPFLDRNSHQGAWDHAHAWIDEQVLVGDEVYLYYAGYQSGHKVNRFQERQIGLIKMKRDRYVGLEAKGRGHLQTRPLLLDGRRLFLNADASHGEVRVRLVTAQGKPIPGFDFEDCTPIRADSVRCPILWKGSSTTLPHKSVRIEIDLTHTTLYALESAN